MSQNSINILTMEAPNYFKDCTNKNVLINWAEAKEVRRLGMFEVHIAASKTELTRQTKLLESLRAAGFIKNKYFIDIFNLAGNPLTGHDLKGRGPGTMSTMYVRTIEEAASSARLGMQILREHNIDGNFEIEQVLSPDIKGYDEKGIKKIHRDLAEFKEPKEVPRYENHVVWSGRRTELPTFDKIDRLLRNESIGSAHQIVEFSEQPNPGDSDKVTRVATTYFVPIPGGVISGHEGVISLSDCYMQPRVRERLGYEYLLQEQVIFVGEPR